MIRDLQNMVRGNNKPNKPKHVGFWKGAYDPGFPDVRQFIDHSWSVKERDIVLAYVENAPFSEHWMGWSDCRLCGCQNGSRDRSDGVYVWPEGLGHYIRHHGVKPPVDFIAHVLHLMTP